MKVSMKVTTGEKFFQKQNFFKNTHTCVKITGKMV